jgi:hypothetical protein
MAAVLAALLWLGGAPSAWAQPVGPKPERPANYSSVHEPPPAWLAERFKAVEARVGSPNWNGPKADPAMVRGFLAETYEHIREVNTLLKAVGGKARPIPANQPSGKVLRGIHDFGERVSLSRLETFLEKVRAEPLTDFKTKKPVPVPAWLEGLARDARARGAKSVDVGKLSPYVAAGLAQTGAPDRYAIELHRLAPHHGAANPRGTVLKEMIADRINAMRQVRVYSKSPMSFQKIAEIILADVGKGLPADSRKLVLESLEAQRRLERSRKVNPYHLLEAPTKSAPKADRLARYRRADGTLDWGKLGKARALEVGGGVAHFGLALFLKELAVVAQTGDEARLEEFFEGLLTTDFYVEYGLFAVGAAGGEIAYARYLQRYVKPRFVSSILRTNLALATGLAIPQLVHGNFSGKAFAVSLGSLGLSATAVKTGVQGIRWVRELHSARRGATTIRAAGRLARAGGWFYTVAETAVVLYLAEEVEERVNAYLDERAAKEGLVEANADLRAALADPDATPATVQAAVDAQHSAWSAYRDHLYRPLAEADATLAYRLEKVASEAKQTADQRAALLERVQKQPALRERVLRRYPTFEAYADARFKAAEESQAKSVSRALESYERARHDHLARIYRGETRSGELLGELDSGWDWLLRGGAAGAAGDPYGTRTSVMARIGRGRLEAALEDRIREVSPNRLQSYADEAELLLATASALEEAGRQDLAAPLRASAAQAKAEQELDRQTLSGGLVNLDESEREGATDALRRGMRQR